MREQLLRGIYFIVRRYAWSVLIISVLLSATGLYYIRDLQMRSSFLDLLPQDDELLNRFKEKEEILQKTDAVTIVLYCDFKPPAKPPDLPVCQKDLVSTAETIANTLSQSEEIIAVTYYKDPQAAEGEQLLSKREQFFVTIRDQIQRLRGPLNDPALSRGESVNLAEIYHQFNRVLGQIQPLSGDVIRNPIDLFKLPPAVPLYEGIQRLKKINTDTKEVLKSIPGALQAGQESVTKLLATLDEIEKTLNELLKFKKVINFSKDGYALRLDTRPRYSSQKGLDYTRKIANLIKQILESSAVKQALSSRKLQAAYTGSYIIATDSNYAINSDMLNTTIISAIGIALIVVLTLRRVLYPLMAMVSLFVALIMTFAWAKFAVGGLNLVTSFLPSLILGLGIDYGINFIAHFNEERRHGRKLSSALYHTMLNKGGALITATLTTSMVLFSLMISRSPGLSEMGIISGMGVLLSLMATLFILPSLILVTNLMSRRHLRRVPQGKENYWYGRLIGKLRWGIVAVVIVVSIWVFQDATQIGFRFADEELAPKDLPSQLVMRKQVRERFDVGPGVGEYFLFFTRDRTELQRVYDELQKITIHVTSEGKSQTVPAVDKTLSLSLFLPPESSNIEDLARQYDLQGRLNQAIQSLNVLGAYFSQSEQLLQEVEQLTKSLQQLSSLATVVGTNETFRHELLQLISQATELWCLLALPHLDTTYSSVQEYKTHVTNFSSEFQMYLNQCPSETLDVTVYSNKIGKVISLVNQPKTTIEEINNSTDLKELTELLGLLKPQTINTEDLKKEIRVLSDRLKELRQKVDRLLNSAAELEELSTLLQKLPQDLRERFVTSNGEFITYAHVRREVITRRDNYQEFKKQLAPIEAGALGVPMIAERLEKSIQKDFLNTTYFAVGIIFLVLAIGLRGILLGPIWGMIPVGLGFLWMLAGMHYLGIDFNFANIIISSLLIGSGVDFAVYVIDSYARHRSIEKALSETAIPVLGTALTVMVSFGSLLFANTPGLQYFGKSALMGIGFTTLFTLVLLPAILSLRSDLDWALDKAKALKNRKRPVI